MVTDTKTSFANQLRQELGALLPSSPVALDSPIDLHVECPQAEPLQRLYADVARLHPEAGRHYWTAHTWRTCMWVPVYATVLAFERHRCLADPRQMQVRYENGLAVMTHLPDQAITTEIADESPAATALGEALEAVRRTLEAVMPIPAKLAGRHTADSVLAALLLYYHDLPQYSNALLRERGQVWLSALGLSNESGYLQIDMRPHALPDRLSLNRRVCCQYFRCPNAELCNNCPKIPLEQRLPLLAEEWARHDKAHAGEHA